MNATMDQVQELLRSQLSPLDARAEELEKELANVNSNRKRLQAALEALGAPPAKPKGRSTRKCVTKDVVIQLIEQLLSGVSPLSPNDLDQQVRAKVKELGYSLSGITLRINEALKERQFGRTADGKIGVRKNPGNGIDPTRKNNETSI